MKMRILLVSAWLLSGMASGAQAAGGIDWTDLGNRIARTLVTKARLTEPKSVAVVPLEAEGKGVYYLGDLLARRIEAGLVGLPNVKVLTRREFNKLMQEDNLGYAGFVDRREDVMSRMSADLLVVGRTTPASESVHVDCQLIDSHGAVLGTASIRDGVPITEEVRGLLRWQQRPEQTVAGKTDLAELCLDYSFDVLRHGKYSTQLTDDMTMRTGEKFRLRVRPLSDCYVYLLLFDSAGKAEVLLPHARIVQSNQLRGGVLYTFPSPTLGYELVPPTGTEHLWLVASYEPLSELKDLIAKLEAGGDALAVSQHIRKHVEEVATRGMKVQGDQPQELKSGYQVRGLPPSSLRSVIIGGESEAGDSSPQLLQCNGATTALVQLKIQHK